MDVRDGCELGSRHQAYTTVQGVFQVFRRRLALADAIRFIHSNESVSALFEIKETD